MFSFDLIVANGIVGGKKPIKSHHSDAFLCDLTFWCEWFLGWQYRWFTVDPQTGTLSYYLCENSTESVTAPSILGNTPRWQEHLAGAVVCPSDEDSRTFTIGTANGDTLKLRANDARARQEWVDALRNIAECHTQVRLWIEYACCFMWTIVVLKRISLSESLLFRYRNDFHGCCFYDVCFCVSIFRF